MAKLKVVPFEPNHVVTFLQAGMAPEAGHYNAIDYAQFLSYHDAFSAENGVGVVGSGGVYKLWTGVGEAWAFLTSGAKHAPFLLRAMKRTIEDIAKRRKYHRIQMNVDFADPKALRFAEALGFSFEGVMRAYSSDKKEYARFAKIWQ